jgi:hypothetical protein
MTVKAKTAAPEPMAAFEQAAAHAPEAMLALTRFQTTMFDAVLRQNIEMLDFLKERFQRDRQLVHELAQTSDPSDIARVWSEFWKKAVEEYSDEPRRLGDAMARATTDALARARSDAEHLVGATKATAV